MQTSPAGIALIKEFEGCRLEAYLCPAGVPTIGYGSTFGVQIGDKITQDDAERRLRMDLIKFEMEVEDALSLPPGSPARPVTQNQFDALVSLCYNIGPPRFRASTVIRKFCAGDIPGAAQAFLLWTKAGGKDIPGLVRRRKAEVALFLGVQSNKAGV